MASKVTGTVSIDGTPVAFEVDLTQKSWTIHPDPEGEAKNLIAKEVAHYYKRATGEDVPPSIEYVVT